jgi:hypothetical protein
MREAESFNFSVNINGEEKSGSKKITDKTGFYRHDSPNLEDIINFIKNKKLTEESEKKMINLAKNTPHGSLPNFRKNFNIYLNKVTKNAK